MVAAGLVASVGGAVLANLALPGVGLVVGAAAAPVVCALVNALGSVAGNAAAAALGNIAEPFAKRLEGVLRRPPEAGNHDLLRALFKAFKKSLGHLRGKLDQLNLTAEEKRACAAWIDAADRQFAEWLTQSPKEWPDFGGALPDGALVELLRRGRTTPEALLAPLPALHQTDGSGLFRPLPEAFREKLAGWLAASVAAEFTEIVRNPRDPDGPAALAAATVHLLGAAADSAEAARAQSAANAATLHVQGEQLDEIVRLLREREEAVRSARHSGNDAPPELAALRAALDRHFEELRAHLNTIESKLDAIASNAARARAASEENLAISRETRNLLRAQNVAKENKVPLDLPHTERFFTGRGRDVAAVAALLDAQRVVYL